MDWAWPLWEKPEKASVQYVVLKSSRDAVEAKLAAAEQAILELQAEVAHLRKAQSVAPVKLQVQLVAPTEAMHPKHELRLAQAQVEVLTGELTTLQARVDALSRAAEAAAKQEDLQVQAPELKPLMDLVQDTQTRCCASGADQPSWGRTRQLQGVLESLLVRVSQREEVAGSLRPDIRQAAELVGLPVPVDYGQAAQPTKCVVPISPGDALDCGQPDSSAGQDEASLASRDSLSDMSAAEDALDSEWQHNPDTCFTQAGEAPRAGSATLSFSHSSSPVCHATSSVSSSLPDASRGTLFTRNSAHAQGAQLLAGDRLYWTDSSPMMFRNQCAAGSADGSDEQRVLSISDRLYTADYSEDADADDALLGLDLDKYHLTPMEPPPDFSDW